MRGVTHGERRHDDREKREELHGGGALLKAAAHLHAGQLQRDQADEHGDRHHRDRQRERRQKHSCEFREPNRDIAENGAVAQPVGPSDGESHTVAERVACVDVIATFFGQHRSELREARGAERRVQPADDPDTENGGWSRQLTGHEAGRAKDTDAERAADDDGQAEAEAEHAAKTARRRGTTA